MKKLDLIPLRSLDKIIPSLLFLILACFVADAQNYNISFAGTGESTVVDSVRILNVTQETSAVVSGAETLNLVDKLTGIAVQGADNKSIQVYPNPMKENATVEFTNKQKGHVAIWVFDISGKQVAYNQQKLNAGKVSCQISGVKAGTYFVEVQTPAKKFSAKLISTNGNNNSAKILLQTGNNSITLKSAQKEDIVEMRYHEGDSLLFIGYSGELTDTVGYVLTSDMAIEFNFESPVIALMRECYSDFKSYIEYSFLFDAAYSNSMEMSADWNTIASHYQTTTDSKVSSLWFNAYDIIYRLNTVLEDALQMNNESDQQLVSAQAKCIRGYLYYTLAFWFGSVPIEEGSVSGNTPQVTLDEMYSYILNDLNEAFSNLPATVDPSEEIALTKFFASGIKARTLLMQDGMDKVQMALNVTSQIINSGQYALSTEADNFVSDSPENIFGFDEVGNASFIQNYSWQFVPAMRYTEVILMYAEASFKLGQMQNALQFMNMLLARRGMAPLAEVSLNDIYQQWKTELKYEGCTFNYYKRFGKIQEELGIDGPKILLPIPMEVLNTNPNIFQNPGY